MNRTRHNELENISQISSNNKLNIFADNYTSIAGKTSAKDLNISVKEDVNISSQKLSGEQKFGKDGNNFNFYAFESNIGSNINAEKINIDAKNMNIKGSAVVAKNANLAMNKLNIDSNVDKIDTESRSKSKGFLSSKSKTEIQHSENNIAGTLYIENKGVINSNVNVVGSNLVLGKDSYIDGELTTDSKATYNKYILEEKKKGLSLSMSKNSFNVAYGKNQFNYDEKDKTNIKSNLVLGDGTVLNKGVSITATNFNHGNIEVNNGDVVYGARKDERDVKTSTKSSSFGISANVSSPALERIKQGANALEQIGNGDALGGLVNVGNVVTGTVDGLASNIKTKDGKQATAEDIKDNDFRSNNNFYMQAGISTGYSKSKQETKSHTEKAVVTNITGLDENAKITYNDNKNIRYQGTQAQDTTFVYNNVENITKEAVELNNYYKSKGSSSGIGVSVGITDSEPSISLNVNASKNKLNTDETVYQNGSFVDVNEVHNNTKNMQLSGFTQTGGKVTGNIENLNIESKQNTSKTKGDTKGTNLGVNLLTGTPTGNISASRTDGDRNFVDNQTTFVVGENSNLKIGNVDNTASIIGTTDNGKISIENYTGRNLENSDKLKTVGGSIGTSGAGFNYSNSEKEGIARNTVIGNVSIENTNNSNINYDITKTNEITKDKSSSTNVYVEDNLVKAIAKPEKFKEKVEVAKIEVDSLKGTVTKTVENIIVGDKSQDKGDPERRNLTEIKESVIRTQTAPEMELIAKEKDFSSKEILEKLDIKAIEKFDINSSELPEGVKERKEELNAENKELVSFYDETTNKIFISKDIKDKTEIRALIAREWKISEDLKDKKGKSNDKDELRATVAGEIAYEEIKNRAKKGETEEFDISKLNNAVMDKDTVVSADKYGEIKEGIENISLAGLKYSASTSDINDNPNKLDEKTKIALKEEAEKLLEEFDENVDYMKKGWNRPEYIEAELPKLEKEILVEKDPLRKNLLEVRKEYLERELNYSNVGKEFATGLVSGASTTAVITAAASVAPVPTTIAVIGGIAASTLNNKEEAKIEITSAEQTYLQNVTPKFYRTTKNLFVVNDKANKNNTEVLSMAKEFYSNAKTPDEKLSNEVGFGVGGALGNKAVNTINSKLKIQEMPQLKDLKPKSITERFNAKFTGSQKGYEVLGDYNKALEDFYSLNPKEVKATDKGFTGKIITADGREINITVRNNSSQKSGGVPTIDLKDPKLKNSSKIRYIGK